MEDRQFTDAGEFLEALRLSREPWRSGTWIFRGQADSAWRLVPRIGREGVVEQYEAKLRPMFRRAIEAVHEPKWWGQDVHREQRAHDLISRLVIQGLGVSKFASLADELGYPVGSGPVEDFDDLLRRLKNQAPPSWDFTPTPAMALAQHHGLPTVLLDWTWNPLVAAFFAAQDASAAIDEATRLSIEVSPSKALAVFALDVTVIGGDEPVSLYRCPRHDHSFLHAQHGVFTHWRIPWNTVDSMKGWSCQSEGICWRPETDRLKHLKRLLLPVSRAKELLSLLDHERISRAHLMPTLDNIASHVSTILAR